MQHQQPRPGHSSTTTGFTTRITTSTKRPGSSRLRQSSPQHYNWCATMQLQRPRPGHFTTTTGIYDHKAPQHNNRCASMQHPRPYPGHPTTTTGITTSSIRSGSSRPRQYSPQHHNRCATMQHQRTRPGHSSTTTGFTASIQQIWDPYYEPKNPFATGFSVPALLQERSLRELASKGFGLPRQTWNGRDVHAAYSTVKAPFFLARAFRESRVCSVLTVSCD